MTMARTRRPAPASSKPIKPVMAHEEVKQAIKITRKQYEKYNAPFCRYEPSDGIDSSHRRLMYMHERYKMTKHKMWYDLHRRKINKIDAPDFPNPISSAFYTDQVEKCRRAYDRCRIHAFCTDPWPSNIVDEYFAKRPSLGGAEQQARDGARDGWTFEHGFEKCYRELPEWNDVHFDDPDLGPEETAPNEVAKEWIDAYLERNPSNEEHLDSLRAGRVVVSCAPSPALSTIYSPDLNRNSSTSKRRSWIPNILRISSTSNKLQRSTPPSEDFQERNQSVTPLSTFENCQSLAKLEIIPTGGTCDGNEEDSDSSSRSTIRAAAERADAELIRHIAKATLTESKEHEGQRIDSATEVWPSEIEASDVH